MVGAKSACWEIGCCSETVVSHCFDLWRAEIEVFDTLKLRTDEHGVNRSGKAKRGAEDQYRSRMAERSTD